MGISQETVQQSFNSLKGLAEALIGNAGQLTELVEQLQRVMQNATKPWKTAPQTFKPWEAWLLITQTEGIRRFPRKQLSQ